MPFKPFIGGSGPVYYPAYISVTASPFTAVAEQAIYNVNNASAQTFNMPTAASMPSGATITVMDGSGAANTNNITIVPSGSDNIQGANANFIHNVNRGCLCFASDGVLNWNLVNSVQIGSQRVTGAGTAYSLTTSLAAVTFGTTSPTLALPVGTFLLMGCVSFSGGSVSDHYQAQLYNTTASAAIGITHDRFESVAADTSDIVAFEVVSLAAASTVTVRATNLTGARGTIVAANTYLIAIRMA